MDTFYSQQISIKTSYVLKNVQNTSKNLTANPFSGGFPKLRKIAVSFVMSVCPSVCLPACLRGTTRLQLDGSSWNLLLEYFQKSVEEIQVSLKSDRNNWVLYMRKYTFTIVSCRILLKDQKYPRQKPLRKPTHTFYIQQLFFWNLYEIMCKKWHSPTSYIWQYSTKHAHCVLDK